MSATLAQATQGNRPSNRTPTLIGLFWVFSYVLLTIRGAIFHDNWGRLVDNNRLLAVTVGAGAFAMVLRQLESRHRITLRSVVLWIFGATLAVMIVRVTVDELMFRVPDGLEANLLWSLTWSAYFGLWVMASLAFGPAQVQPPAAVQTPVAAKAVQSDSVRIDSLELMVISIIADARDLKAKDRAELAARVLALGCYESADDLPGENERARLTLKVAAKLAEIR